MCCQVTVTNKEHVLMKMYPYSFNVTFMKSKPLQDGRAACFTLLQFSIQLFKKNP